MQNAKREPIRWPRTLGRKCSFNLDLGRCPASSGLWVSRSHSICAAPPSAACLSPASAWASIQLLVALRSNLKTQRNKKQYQVGADNEKHNFNDVHQVQTPQCAHTGSDPGLLKYRCPHSTVGIINSSSDDAGIIGAWSGCCYSAGCSSGGGGVSRGQTTQVVVATIFRSAQISCTPGSGQLRSKYCATSRATDGLTSTITSSGA